MSVDSGKPKIQQIDTWTEESALANYERVTANLPSDQIAYWAGRNAVTYFLGARSMLGMTAHGTVSTLPALLDLGCFDGSNTMATGRSPAWQNLNRQPHVVGIDINPAAIAKAEMEYGHVSQVKFHLDTPQDVNTEIYPGPQKLFPNDPTAREKYDMITAFFVIPTLDPEQLNKMLGRIYNSLDNGGYFLALTLAPESFTERGYYASYRHNVESGYTTPKHATQFRNHLILPDNSSLYLQDWYYEPSKLVESLGSLGFDARSFSLSPAGIKQNYTWLNGFTQSLSGVFNYNEAKIDNGLNPLLQLTIAHKISEA